MMSFDIAIAPIVCVFSFVIGFYSGKMVEMEHAESELRNSCEYNRSLVEANCSLVAQVNTLRSRINEHCSALMDFDDHEKND